MKMVNAEDKSDNATNCGEIPLSDKAAYSSKNTNSAKKLKKIPAVVLAAGQGKRLLPLTNNIPKALVKVGRRPILEYVLLNLLRAGVRHFFLVTGYKSDLVEKWVYETFCTEVYTKHEKTLGFEAGPLGFSFIHQDNLNGTGGATLLTENHINKNGYEDFILTYGDILANLSVYKKLFQIYQQEEHDLYLVGNPTEDASEGAAIFCNDSETLVTNLIEKPDSSAPKATINNSGIYIFKKDIFDRLKKTPLSIRGEIELTAPIVEMINEKKNVRLVKMTDADFWCDVGSIETVEELNSDLSWKNMIYN